MRRLSRSFVCVSVALCLLSPSSGQRRPLHAAPPPDEISPACDVAVSRISTPDMQCRAHQVVGVAAASSRGNHWAGGRTGALEAGRGYPLVPHGESASHARAAPSFVVAQTPPDVRAFGVGDDRSPVYIASARGLYRSTWRPGAWARQNTLPFLQAVSSRPDTPDDVVFAATSRQGDYLARSLDGGRTSTVVTTSATLRVTTLARDPQTPSLLYAGGGDQNAPAIYRSQDDGRVWTRIYTVAMGDPNPETVTALAIDPIAPAHLLAGITGYHGGKVIASRDAGAHWHELPPPGGSSTVTMAPQVLAINPLHGEDLWAGWSLPGMSGGAGVILPGVGQFEHSRDGGRTWIAVTAGLPQLPAVSSITFDPRGGRIYVDLTSQDHLGGSSAPSRPRIFTSHDGVQFEPFAPATTRVGARMVIRSAQGQMLTGDDAHPLWASPLVGPGLWTVGVPFASSYAVVNAPRLLGRPISPLTLCGPFSCQLFEKGRLEDHSAFTSARATRIAFGPLTTALFSGGSPLPVGGSTSTISYHTLAALAATRVRVVPPSHFRGGVAAVTGGTFIPDSPTLGVAPGHVVPPYFWHFMTDRRVTPGGWLHDLGLPLTEVVSGKVTKGPSRARRITAQAFQFAILTYDPQNPPAWRVERANLGSDYAQAFPESVR